METRSGKNSVRRRKRGREDEEEKGTKKTGKVVIDFSLVYKRGLSNEGSRGPAGVKDLEETVYTATHNLVDDNGILLESRVVEESSWSTEEVEYLIMLRSQGDALFDQALKDKKLGRTWEKAAVGLSKVAKIQKDARQCQWMWYMLMKEYNNVLQGRKKEDEFPFYPQMQETRKYRVHIDGPVK